MPLTRRRVKATVASIPSVRRGLLCVVVLVGLACAFTLGTWVVLGMRAHEELRRAREEMARGGFVPAAERLASAPRFCSSELRAEVDYLLGVCYWNQERRDDAVLRFSMVSADSPFGMAAAAYLSRDDLDRGRVRNAEDRLEPMVLLNDGRQGADLAFECMRRVYRIQGRVRDQKRILRMRAIRGIDPVGALIDLWLLDYGTGSVDKLRSHLERLAKTAPRDDRIWLGLAWTAIESGDWREARKRLDDCRTMRPNDQAVWFAKWELARRTDRVDAAERAFRRLLGKGLEPRERYERLAWLARRTRRRQAERRALDLWLTEESNDPVALELQATLASEEGNTKRAGEFRARKQAVNRSIEAYRNKLLKGAVDSIADRLEAARLAIESGRSFDARLWLDLAERAGAIASATRDLRGRLSIATGERDEDTRLWSELLEAARRTRTDAETIVKAPLFRDDARRAGLNFVFRSDSTALRRMPEALSGGVGLLDFDGDGLLDVYVTQGGSFPNGPTATEPGDRLFRNRGDGSFEDATARAGLVSVARGYGHGVAVGDVDNDGKPDLFVTRWNRYALYRNLGGRFEDATEGAGLGGPRGWPTSAAFADFDGDGDLDLYVCHYMKWDPEDPRPCLDAHTNKHVYCNPRDFPAESDHIFINESGHFRDATESAGMSENQGRGLGAVAADFDDDGLIDVFVANDSSANFLWRNLGGFRFEERGLESGIVGNAGGGFQACMGVALGDVDRDGRPDLGVTNFYGESTSVYRGLGGGLFAEQSGLLGVAGPSKTRLGFGIGFFDFDNDGYLDLLTANGHIDDLGDIPYKMPFQLLVGTARGRFVDVTARSDGPLTIPRLGRAAAFGDLDNDGRVDAVVVDLDSPLVYLHNQTSLFDDAHYLSIELEGVRSNRDAVGAKAVIRSDRLRLVGWRHGGGSYQSSSDPRLHFGLGRRRRVDSVEIRWPSGLVERLEKLEADATYRIREGAGIVGSSRPK